MLICSGPLFLIIARALTAAADLVGRYGTAGREFPASASVLLAAVVVSVLLVNGALFLKGAQIDRRLPMQPATVAELYGPYSAAASQSSTGKNAACWKQ